MRRPLRFLLAVLIATGSGAGCRPATPARQPAPETTPVRDIAAVIAAHVPGLMQHPGVVGVYEGETRDHRPCIRIMVKRRTPELTAVLPKRLDGYPVEIEETGDIVPLGR